MSYILTEIEEISKNKRRLHFDSGIVLPMSSFETSKRGLTGGMELNDADYEALIHDVTVKAEKYILGLLTDSDRTRKEITDKLKQAGYPEEVMNEALAYVDYYGYIDDERYARAFAEHYRSSLSSAAIRNKLLQKGVSKDLIDEALAQEVPDESAQIKDILRRRFTDKGLDLTDRKTRDKAMRYLLSRGYSYSDIREAF